MSQDKMQDMGFNGSAYGENVYDDDDDTLRGLEFEKDDFLAKHILKVQIRTIVWNGMNSVDIAQTNTCARDGVQ